jgi:hypothetical protein
MHSRFVVFLLITALLAGCGTRVPDLNEPFERKSQVPIRVANIIAHIQCEIQRSVQTVIIADLETQELAAREKPELGQGRSLQWLEDYAAQATLTLTLEETTAFNASAGLINPLPNDIINAEAADPRLAITTQQNQTLGLSTAYSTKATVKDTVALFVPFRSFTTPEAIARERLARSQNRGLSCKKAGGRLIEGDLKLEAWLQAVLLTSYGDQTFASSLALAQQATKKDVIQHQVTFVVSNSGGINPSLKLVNMTVNQGTTSFLSGARLKTQDVIITMGKNTNGALSPTATNTLLSSQINSQRQ